MDSGRQGRGLQPERTAIAWVRTGLILVVNAVLLAREGFTTDRPVIGALLLVVSALFCLGYLVLFYIRSRCRDLAHYQQGMLPGTEIIIVSALAVVAAAAAAIAILVSLLDTTW